MGQYTEAFLVDEERLDTVRDAKTSKQAVLRLKELLEVEVADKRRLAHDTVVQFAYGDKDVRKSVRRTLSEADGIDEVINLLDKILGE